MAEADFNEFITSIQLVKYETLNLCWLNADPRSTTLDNQ